MVRNVTAHVRLCLVSQLIERAKAAGAAPLFNVGAKLFVLSPAEFALLQASPHVSQDHLRHFGLQLVEHAVVAHWTTAAEEEKGAIKDGIVALARTGIRDIAREVTFVIEKLAGIVVRPRETSHPR